MPKLGTSLSCQLKRNMGSWSLTLYSQGGLQKIIHCEHRIHIADNSPVRFTPLESRDPSPVDRENQLVKPRSSHLFLR
jgi:hypothetical protein